MGNSGYSLHNRHTRSINAGYHTKSKQELFGKEVHQGMNPRGIKFREARDSETHPETIPIQLYLDVTGSMGHIPHELIKDGLPTLMGKLIQNGATHASLMFGAIGDHECDNAPLQVAQFESGDAELDMWLTRTWLEGNGGGNGGESYLLAWYFAANHIKTDAFEKRGKKGFVITVGDEPCLKNLPMSSVKEIMGDTAVGQGTYGWQQLLDAAKKENHVFHIHVDHGRSVDSAWKEILGENLIVIDDYKKLPNVISEIILKEIDVKQSSVKPEEKKEDGNKKEEIIL